MVQPKDGKNQWFFRCKHQQPYSFFSIFANFWTLVDKSGKPTSADPKQNNSLYLGWKFSIISKGKILIADRKSPYIVIYLWAGVRNYVCSIILVITKIYIFPLLYFTSVLLLIMRSQPSSIAWTVTSTAAFCLCWSYKEHSDLWIRCVVNIWY